MKPRIVAGSIVNAWLLVVIPTSYNIVSDATGYMQVTKYGTCLIDGAAFLEALIIYIILILLAPIFTSPSKLTKLN